MRTTNLGRKYLNTDISLLELDIFCCSLFTSPRFDNKKFFVSTLPAQIFRVLPKLIEQDHQKQKLPECFQNRKLKLFSGLFCEKTLGNKIRIFQASGIFHVLPQIKMRNFQKKSIMDLNPLKPLLVNFINLLYNK